ELVEDSGDRFLEVRLVRPLVIRDGGHAPAAPEELLRGRVNHVDDHTPLRVLGDVGRSPAAPPAGPPRVPVVPPRDVELLLGRGGAPGRAARETSAGSRYRFRDWRPCGRRSWVRSRSFQAQAPRSRP